MATGDATWKVGTITVPSSTGSQAITGLGGEPKAVFFYGTNWLTEDTAVTSTGTGIFRGMAAPKYDAPSTIVQSSGSIIPAGNAQYVLGTRAIGMLDTSGGLTHIHYAQVTSFDADGFTLNWQAVTAGGYKVVYVALMGAEYVGAFQGFCNQSGVAFGFKAGASLLHGVWGGDGSFNAANSDRTQNFYGGGAYPGTSDLAWMSAGMTAFCTNSNGSTILYLTEDGPHIRVAGGGKGGIAGTFVSSNIIAAPTGTGLADLSFTGESADSGMVVAWDDEDSATWTPSIPDNEDDTTTKTGLPFAPGLLLGYSISDEPNAFANYGAGNERGANGFSIVTPDFQWTALVDGVSSRGAYQSFQRGFCDRVSGTSIHAGTVELTSDGCVMTAVEDDLDTGSVLWHAFGHPLRRLVWLPQIYRYLVAHGYSGVRPPVAGSIGQEGEPWVPVEISTDGTITFTGYVLLEGGDQIILEDGTGFLLL